MLPLILLAPLCALSLPLTLGLALPGPRNTSPAPSPTRHLISRTLYGSGGSWGKNDCTDNTKTDRCFSRGWGWGCDVDCKCTPPETEPYCKAGTEDEYDECAKKGHGWTVVQHTDGTCECTPPKDVCEDTKYAECDLAKKGTNDKCECECKPWVIWYCHQKGGYLDSDCGCVEPSTPAHHRRARSPSSLRRAFASSCPVLFSACAAQSPLSHIQGVMFECVDTRVNLEQCGGCAGEGGRDCAAIEGVEDVECEMGRCAVRACETGWEVDGAGEGCVRV